ncbi:MAG: phosphopyruvate hydratase [Lachnospiraceae bacterium]|nr:phosphopyruvate hydratase [Lachnospiraceae bacterium]
MLHFLKIVRTFGRQVLDSRGNPTVEAVVVVKNEMSGELSEGTAIVPSGASTGAFEAVELRDGGQVYFGKGVTKAVENIQKEIEPAILGLDVTKQRQIDSILRQLDGTEDKSRLGANAMLAVSMAVAKAAANALHIPLYQYLGGAQAGLIPTPMMNILNGGAHSGNSLDVQEFMIVPVGACCIKEGIRWCVEVYHSLNKLLKEKGLATGVGDEGGFAPDLESEIEAIELIMEAITKAGFTPGKDMMISLDVAASEWKCEEMGKYLLPKQKRSYTTGDLIEEWIELKEKYPIFSIEDPLDENDWSGWQELTKDAPKNLVLVGDDLFVTNKKRLQRGIDKKTANAILIKPNQIGTLTETMETVQLAQRNGYKTIMSHRSGETEDTFIADLAVALNTGYIKTGAPCRGERTAKYNRLLVIEEELR